MKLVDTYVSIEAYKMNLTFSVEPQISLEQLAASVNRLRKTVIDLDSEEIPIIINGYL